MAGAAVALWGLLAATADRYDFRGAPGRAARVLGWLALLLTVTAMLLRDHHWLSDLIGGAAIGIVLLGGCCSGSTGSRCDTGRVREGGVVRRRVPRSVLAAVLALGWPLVPSPAAAEQSGAGTLCTIRDSRIPESSGLAAAEDVLYTVNDGGTRLRVFVLDRSCQVRRTVDGTLDPYDVEDLARSGDGTLWLADTGDNARSRSTVALERLRPDGSATLLRLTYPDGPHDAEALLLDAGGRPFVVTKDPLSGGVYTPAGPLSSRRATALRRVTTLSFAPTGTAGGPVGTASQVLVTGGSVSADGRLVVLRTYTDAYVWSAPDGDVEAALSGRPRRIPLPATAQGEAVAVSPDGRSLLTTTEGLPGPVHEVPLGDAAPPAATPSSGPGAAPDETAAGGDGETTSLLGPALGVAALASLVLLAGRLVRRR